MNLIEKFGYEKVKEALDNLIEGGKDLITVGRAVYVRSEIERMLLEHRRANNVFEPSDYIIHDGDLKVFAMWSEAVNGCAYIGYAYADDGEMAHANEFRHAIDEEISVGRKL